MYPVGTQPSQETLKIENAGNEFAELGQFNPVAEQKLNGILPQVDFLNRAKW